MTDSKVPYGYKRVPCGPTSWDFMRVPITKREYLQRVEARKERALNGQASCVLTVIAALLLYFIKWLVNG